MAIGKRSCSSKNTRHVGEEEELGLECVGLTRSYSFGRKRILITSNAGADSLPVDTDFKTPLKRHRSGVMIPEPDKSSRLQNLPEDLLVRILCRVDHDDLKQLFRVSKTFREATLTAKETHFAYSTPRKTVRTAFIEKASDFDEFGAPNAPKVPRSYKSRLNGKNLADLSVALFASPRKGLFMETEL